MRKQDDEVINIQEQLDNKVYTVEAKQIEFNTPKYIGLLDWDKVETVQDIVALLKIAFPGKQAIYAYQEHHEGVKHLLKDEDIS